MIEIKLFCFLCLLFLAILFFLSNLLDEVGKGYKREMKIIGHKGYLEIRNVYREYKYDKE